MAMRPADVGILAMECYFPKNYLPQTALEEQDGCAGKYTVGLGQTALSYYDDREDIASIMLTALSRLLEGYGIAPADIGRLEVGTETLVDKSKSVKTTLLSHLFPGCTDVEGVTSTNACYGGTAALLNSVAWVESSAYDGRYAVVVCGDIAVYAPGPARPTGGGGAVAMLIGPNAPLVLTGPRCTHAVEVYDFYKPHGDSEYAVVDGKLSQSAYLTAVDTCWAGLKKKLAAANAKPPTIDEFQYACLHSPYNKLVQKGFARIVLGDFLDSPSNPEWADDADAQKYATATAADTVNDRDVEKVAKRLSDSRFVSMCGPTHTISQQVGNCYTGAVYMNLLSLVANEGAQLEGKRILMFSYGSGAVATAFCLEGKAPSVNNCLSKDGQKFTLERIQTTTSVLARLQARQERDVVAFNSAMDLRAERYGKSGYQPSGLVSDLFPGTFYLESVDDLHRRSYGRAA